MSGLPTPDVTRSGRSGSAPAAWAKRLLQAPWFGAVVAIIVLLVIDLIRDPGYLSVVYNPDTGHLVGNVIDIMRAAAPIMMISIGMLLVIATAGIDLSVGSVMAAAGAV